MTEYFKEITIKLSNDEQTYTKKIACYEPITLSPEDPIIKEYLEEANKEIAGPFTDCVVKVKMVVL